MTRDEYELAYMAVSTFCDELADIAAKQLHRFHPEVRPHVLMMLQDGTSLYAPYTSDRIQQELKRLDSDPDGTRL